MRFLNAFLFVALTASLVACKKDPGQSHGPTEFLDNQQKITIENATYDQITRLFMSQQVQEYNRLNKDSKETADASLAEIKDLADAAKDKPFDEKKEVYEKAISQKLNGSKILYNLDATTTLHVMRTGRLQCFSGTNLNLLINRLSLSEADYKAQNFVVVVTAGHVAPGQMVKTDDGYNLITIETINSDSGLREYGAASKLDVDIRVIDADLYVRSLIFEEELKKSGHAEQFIKDALSTTAKRYGIPLEKTEKEVAEKIESEKTTESNAAVATAKIFSSSIFSYSTLEVTSGDTERSETWSDNNAGATRYDDYGYFIGSLTDFMNIPAFSTWKIETHPPLFKARISKTGGTLLLFALNTLKRGTPPVFVYEAKCIVTTLRMQCIDDVGRYSILIEIENDSDGFIEGTASTAGGSVQFRVPKCSFFTEDLCKR